MQKKSKEIFRATLTPHSIKFYKIFLQINFHSDSLFYELDAQILYFNTFITSPYMFRALLCSSSGGQLY